MRQLQEWLDRLPKSPEDPSWKRIGLKEKEGVAFKKKALMGKRDPHWKERLGKEKGAPMGKEWFV